MSIASRYAVAALWMALATSSAVADENDGNNGSTTSNQDCYNQAGAALSLAVAGCLYIEGDPTHHDLCINAANEAYAAAMQRCEEGLSESFGTLRNHQGVPSKGAPSGRTFGRGPTLSPVRPNRSLR
jgi:hypothetical protein